MNGLQFLFMYFLANFASLIFFMPRFPQIMQAFKYEEKDSDGNFWSDKQIWNTLIFIFMLVGFPLLIVALLIKTFRR